MVESKKTPGNLDSLLNGFDNTSDMDIIKINKPKRKSILDELEANQVSNPVSNEPIIPKSLADISFENTVQQTVQQTNDKQQIFFAQQRVQQRTQQQTINTQVTQQQVREDLETLTGVQLPDNVDAITLEKEIHQALNELPDEISISDIDIKVSPTEKTKAGYFKTKTNIKKENIPSIINNIASYVKQHTKGIIKPRVVDLRVIANTNKTQLKNNKLKLSASCVVFKPDHTKLKVSKYQRIMISVPDNYESTGNLLVYLQESRSKNIIEIVKSDFVNEQTFLEFLGDRIVEFYYYGYDIIEKKLLFRGTTNPLFDLIATVLRTQQYSAQPYNDAENHIYAVDFKSRNDENQWLIVQVFETDIPNTYDIVAKNIVDDNWEFKLLQKPIQLNALTKNIVSILEQSYSRDWSGELNISDSYDKFVYEYSKLKHAKLKRAAIEIHNLTENNENHLEIKKCLSKIDTLKLMTDDYDSEAILCKSDSVDYFLLTYLAFPIKGGDKRSGKDYITSQEYYEKYGVKDRNQYSDRRRTALKNESEERNYNARVYLFQLEYCVNGMKHVYRNKNWDDLKNNTGILTRNIKFPVTLF